MKEEEEKLNGSSGSKDGYAPRTPPELYEEASRQGFSRKGQGTSFVELDALPLLAEGEDEGKSAVIKDSRRDNEGHIEREDVCIP